MHMKLLSITTGATIALFSGASVAAAQDSASDAYGGHAKGIVTIVNSHDPCAPVNGQVPASCQSSGGSLPFTGLELALVAGGGLALLGAGFGLRRLSRPHHHEV